MTKKRCWSGLLAGLVLVAMGDAGADGLCQAPAAEAGISTDRLKRLDDTIQAYVDEGKAAGVVAYVARAGRIVHLRGYGMADVEAGRAMSPATLFRMASMTKPVTSVAALMLVEEGRISLEDPVSWYLPAFSSPSVAIADGGTGALSFQDARRPITLRDLMTQTSGIPYGLGQSAALWKAAGLSGGYYLERDEPMSALVERMAELPLDAQPGERFVYGHSTDVLGVIIEQVSGMSLDAFFRERIFEPLGMRDAHFYVPPGEADRLAAVYAAGPSGIRRADGPEPLDGQGHFVEGPRKVFSGGAGLVGTAMDYGRFAQMLLNGGELDGVRLLSPRGVALMSSNHVGDRFANDYAPRPGMGFGLGVAVTLDPAEAGMYGTAGAFGFSGAYFTHFWIDPEEQLVMVVLTQLRPVFDPGLHSKFRTLAYQSIVARPPLGKPACTVR